MATDMSSIDESWRTNLLRQNVRNKIEEAIRMSGNPTSKTVSEMENHIYAKEEYLSFVARLILHIKEMNAANKRFRPDVDFDVTTNTEANVSLTSVTSMTSVPSVPSVPSVEAVPAVLPLVPQAELTVPWSTGQWLNPPDAVIEDSNNHLLVKTANETDFWRLTSYGFIHDNGHALLVDFPNESAFEVTFEANFQEQFDQAGIMVRISDKYWIKSGVELTDGCPHLGAVVTRDYSDWSAAKTPDWNDIPITVRASRSADTLTIRAKRGLNGEWNLVRVVPLDRNLNPKVGPFACSPTRARLEVKFTRFVKGQVDHNLHP